MVKGWSELKSLAPFSWDTRVDDHPPGEAAMRDFSDAYAYASSAERPRRSTGQYTQTPTPLIKRKRTSASGGKEARTLSQKKVVRPGQDKENRQTPSTAYVSSRLGLTSPALHTPSHAGTANLEDPAMTNAKPSCDNAHAASTPAMGTVSSHMPLFVLDSACGTPSCAVASAPPSAGTAVAPVTETAAPPALPVGVSGDGRFRSTEGPTQSFPQQDGFNPSNFAKEQQATGSQTREAEAVQAALQRACNCAPACSMHMVSEAMESQSGAGSADAAMSCGPGPSSAQHFMQIEASPMSLSHDQIRQLAPAGPAQYPAPSPKRSEPLQLTPCECPTRVSVKALACSTAQAASVEQMHHPSQQTEGPVVPQICSRLAEAAPSATTSPVPAPVSAAPTHRMPEGSQQQQLGQARVSMLTALQPHSSLVLQKQALQDRVRDKVARSQLPSGSAEPQTAAKPAAELHDMADAVQPAPSKATPRFLVAEAPSIRVPPRGQAAEAAAQQGSRATPITVPPRAQAFEAAARQGSQARNAQAAASRSSRNVSRDRNASGTRMSLRSRNPACDKAIRKASSSSRSGRVRSASDVRAPAYATRSRSNVLAESEAPQHRQDQRNRRRHAGSSSSSRSQHFSKAGNQAVYHGGFAARATSSDLAAAQALAELRHEDEGDTDSMDSGEEEREEEEWRGGSSGAGYDRGFRVTAPPLPLWLPDGTSAAQARERERLPVFPSTACTSATQDWSIGTATPALQVLPRHRRSAAAAAQAMLDNPSPLSGLHKLALSICARKRSIPMQPLAPMPAGGAAEEEGKAGGAAQGKETVTTPVQLQQADAPGGADHAGRANMTEVAQEQADQMKMQHGWDRYVAAQLHGTKDSACRAKLVSALEAELAQPGLGLLARACLLLRLEDAKAGLLYSQYHGILAFCAAQHQV